MRYGFGIKGICLGLALGISGCGGDTGTSKEGAAEQASLLLALPTLTGAYVWTLDTVASTVRFSAHHNGDDFVGDFSGFQTVIKLDPAHPENGEIHAIIDMSSVDAKDDDRNANLPDSDWFNTKGYPYARYVSKDIRVIGEDNFEAIGMLTIKGKSQPVNLKFSLLAENKTASAAGGFSLSRLDFGIGQGSDFVDESWVKFKVDVNVNIKATRK